MGAVRKEGSGSSRRCPLSGQEAMATDWNTPNSSWTRENTTFIVKGLKHWNGLAGEVSVSILIPNYTLGCLIAKPYWKMVQNAQVGALFFCIFLFRLLFALKEAYALLSCFCRLKRLFPVRFVCLEGMSKKFTETKMSIKYRSSLEGRYAVHILPHSNEKLPLRYLNQLINPYYINYDDEKLIIAYWPKNKCKWMREIFKAGWWPQSNILQKSAGGTKQNWVVTAGKNKSINFLGHFQRWWQNCQPSLGN